jgi:hypothetical protein
VLRQNVLLDPPAMTVRAGVPVEPRLEAIASRLLAKQPENRFQSAGELVDAIDAWWVPPRGRRAAAPRPSRPAAKRDESASGFAPTEMSSTQLPVVSRTAPTEAFPSPLPGASRPLRRLVPWIAGAVLLVGVGAGFALMRGDDVASGRGAAVAGVDGTVAGTDSAENASGAVHTGAAVVAEGPDAGPDAGPDEEPAGAARPDAPVETAVRHKKPRDRVSTGKTHDSRQPVTREAYRHRYGELAKKYQRLFSKVGDHSPLQSEVKALGREVESVPYNPDESVLARAYQDLRRLEHRIDRLLKRAGK